MLYVFLKNPVQATDFRRFAERASAGGTCTGQQTGRSGILSATGQNRRFCIARR